MSWKPEVFVEGKWSQNGLAFATEEEAAQSAADLYRRWTMTEDHRAVESDEPVTYRIVDGRQERIPDEPREAAVDGPGGQVRMLDQGRNVVPIGVRLPDGLHGDGEFDPIAS